MAEPFIGQVQIWACNFSPRGWAFCNGQLLPIAQNTALFSLLGTTFGGDGRSTFGLPNLQGRSAMHPGRGPGLTSRVLGQFTGTPTVTLVESQLPNHSHSVGCSTSPGSSLSPVDNIPANSGFGDTEFSTSQNSSFNSKVISSQGGGQAHANNQPFLGLNFCIALVGLYPSRS